MKFPFVLLLASSLCSVSLCAEEATELPLRVRTLKASYEAALARATQPITDAYVKELEKAKVDFTKSGNLESAMAVDQLLTSLRSSPAGSGEEAFAGVPLSQMSLGQFKAWLRSVTITEVDSPFLNQYRLVRDKLVSTRGGGGSDREHENATLEVGKLFVPFTSTNATITFDESLTQAQITYSTGGRFVGKISPR